MNSRNYLKFTLLVCMAFLSLLGCSSEEPELNTIIELRSMSDNDYNQLEGSQLHSLEQRGIAIQDLKKLVVEVTLNIESKLERTVEIEIPEPYAIDRFDRFRSVTGGGYKQNNVSVRELVFDAKGLTDSQLREIYEASIIYVRWQTRNGGIIEKDISIGESMIIR